MKGTVLSTPALWKYYLHGPVPDFDSFFLPFWSVTPEGTSIDSTQQHYKKRDPPFSRAPDGTSHSLSAATPTLSGPRHRHRIANNPINCCCCSCLCLAADDHSSTTTLCHRRHRAATPGCRRCMSVIMSNDPSVRRLLPQSSQMTNFSFAPQPYHQQPRETQKNYVFVDEHNRHKRLKGTRPPRRVRPPLSLATALCADC